ncbi:hypothetical protein E8E13_009050 [Curvularia kusanoi]|uniref:Uncharacterized protein n=1 Tax=Curvularia kusanoi TaxID=90978 RepID=A0A9P4TD00_CURKU|nr:hypothetical protein E8E13_009050 [Curvularia kusanoi]
MKLLYLLFALLSLLSAAFGKQDIFNDNYDSDPRNSRKSDILSVPLLFTPYILLSQPIWVAGIVSAYGLTALLPGGQALLRPIVQQPYWARYELQRAQGCRLQTFPPTAYGNDFFATADTKVEPSRSDAPTPTVLHVSRTTPSASDVTVLDSGATISPRSHTSIHTSTSSLRTASASQPTLRLTESSSIAVSSTAVQLTITGASTCPSEDLLPTSITTSASPRTSLSPSGTADATSSHAIERIETPQRFDLPPYIYVGAKAVGKIVTSFYISLAIYVIPTFFFLLLKDLAVVVGCLVMEARDAWELMAGGENGA